MLQWILESTLIAMAMAIAVCIACRFLRAKPAVCHFLWALVLVRLVAPPISVTHWPPAPMRSQVSGWFESQASTIGQQASHLLSRPGGTQRVDNRSVSAGSAAPVQPNPIEPALLPGEKARPSAPAPDPLRPAPAGAEIRYEVEQRTTPEIASTGSSERSSPVSLDVDSSMTSSELESPSASEMTMTEMKRQEAAWKNLYNDKLAINDGDPDTASYAGMTSGGPRGSAVFARSAGWALIGLWLAGAAVALFIQGRRIVRFHRAVRRAPLASQWLSDRVQRLAAELGTPVPAVRTLTGLSSPVIWGFGTPTLLWPADDAAQVQRDPQRCDGIIVHELAHLRRRDHWMAWFEIFAISLLWWHPLAHLACRRLHEFADLACDSWVVSMLPTHRRTYAASIVDLIEQLSTAPRAALALGVGTSSRRALVERRLVMIVKERTSCRLSPVAAMLALAGAAFLVPSWAGGALEFNAPPAQISIDSTIASDHQPLIKQAILKRCAETFFKAKDWDSASSAYQSIVDADPDNAHAAHRLSYSLIALGEFDRAEQLIERQIELGNEPAIGHYNLACIHARRGKKDRAFDELGKAISWGFDQLELINTDTDLESLREDSRFRGFAGDANFVSSLYEQGGQAIAEEDWEAAVVHYSKLAKLAPNYGQAQHMLSYASILASRETESAAAREHLSRAKASLKKQLELDHLPGIAHYNLACVSAITGDVAAGLKSLAMSIELGFNDVELMTTDPDLEGLRSSSQFDELVASIEDRPETPDAIKEAMDRGEYARAVELLADAQYDKNTKADVSWEVGYDLFGAGRFAEARDAFVLSLKRGHDAGDAIYNLACCQAQMGNKQAALGYLAAAVDAGFTDGDHMRDDGDLSLLRDERRFEDLVHRANDAGVLENFGAVDWTHLLNQSKAAIARDSTKGASYLRLGWAHLRLGQHDEALKAFQKQGELGFAPDIASYNIACCHAAMGRKDAALEVLAQLAVEGGNDLLTAAFVASDPDLKSLRADSRFDAIVQQFAQHEHDHADAHDHDHEAKADSSEAVEIGSKPGR